MIKKDTEKYNFLIFKQYRGFSLLELCFVMSALSILLFSGFSMVNGILAVNKRKETEKKMQIIEKSIAGFVSSYNRLPCPANINLTDNDVNAGLEYCYNLSTSYAYNLASVPSNPTTYSGNNNYILTGTIPFKTLGLGKEYIADGWANKIIYAITLSFAGISNSQVYGTPSTIFKMSNTNMGLLTVMDSTLSIRTNNAAYVLFSTGENGNGSYPRSSSSRNPGSLSDASEQKNYDAVCASYTSSCGKFVAKERTQTYDDIVLYKQKWQLVKDAGYVLSNSVCESAVMNIQTADQNVNNINYSPICSNNPKSFDCSTLVSTFLYTVRELCLN